MDMEAPKRGVGRPRGSGVKNDDQQLMRVADILLDNPKMKPTTAMRHVLRDMPETPRETDVTLIRRWQGRWKDNRKKYLEAAKAQRNRQRSASASTSRAYGHLGVVDHVMEAMRQAEETARVFNSPAYQGAQRALESMNAIQAAIDAAHSPALRAFEEATKYQRVIEEATRHQRMIDGLLSFRGSRW